MNDEKTKISRLAGARILLVDDIKTNQVLMTVMLRSFGINPDVAHNGQEAVDAVKDKSYDLVLMDCQMPVVDGYMATEMIRARERANDLPYLPVIAVTANAMQGDRDACIAAGMDDYLSKPFVRRDLANIIAKWLSEDECHVDIAAQSEVLLSAPHSVSQQQADEDNMPALDGEKIKDLQRLIGENFSLIVASFETDVRHTLLGLRAAATANDIEKIRFSAHSLKGISVNMAAIYLSDICHKLEQQACTGSITDPEGQVAQIEAEYQRTITELRGMI